LRVSFWSTAGGHQGGGGSHSQQTRMKPKDRKRWGGRGAGRQCGANKDLFIFLFAFFILLVAQAMWASKFQQLLLEMTCIAADAQFICCCELNKPGIQTYNHSDIHVAQSYEWNIFLTQTWDGNVQISFSHLQLWWRWCWNLQVTIQNGRIPCGQILSNHEMNTHLLWLEKQTLQVGTHAGNSSHSFKEYCENVFSIAFVSLFRKFWLPITLTIKSYQKAIKAVQDAVADKWFTQEDDTEVDCLQIAHLVTYFAHFDSCPLLEA
jgi:hypothetical protein